MLSNTIPACVPQLGNICYLYHQPYCNKESFFRFDVLSNTIPACVQQLGNICYLYHQPYCNKESFFRFDVLSNTIPACVPQLGNICYLYHQPYCNKESFFRFDVLSNTIPACVPQLGNICYLYHQPYCNKESFFRFAITLEHNSTYCFSWGVFFRPSHCVYIIMLLWAFELEHSIFNSWCCQTCGVHWSATVHCCIQGKVSFCEHSEMLIRFF